MAETGKKGATARATAAMAKGGDILSVSEIESLYDEYRRVPLE